MACESWPLVPLSELTRAGRYGLVDGPFGSAVRKENYCPGGVPVLRGVNLGFGDHRIRLGDLVFISPELAQRHSRALAAADDIVFTKKGTIGSVGIIPGGGQYDRFFISSNQMKATIDKKVANPLFVYYVFASETTRNRLIQEASVTGVPKINLAYLRRFLVPFPPLDEQRRIADVLGALDDKIELNRKINGTLEDIAQALFKSWFIDFDGHDDLVDSELGPIPRGWKVSTVGQEFQLTMGQSPPGSTYNESGGGIPLYQGATDFGFRFPTPRVFCTAPTRLANAGDTLVSVRAPVGTTNMASEICCVGRGVAALRHISGSASYTYAVARNLSSSFDVFNAEGTVFGSINKSDFGKLAVVAPPAESVARFTGSVEALDDRIGLNERQSRTLTTLRDTLLPKLISGEIRVPEAEAAVEAAL